MDDIAERLRKVEPDAPGERTRWYRNPDGPEAADRIDALEAENKALREDAKRIYWAGAKDIRELLAEKMIAFGKSVHTEARPEFPARALLAKGEK